MNAQQLKNAILQEAIQGRLVPQDPNDEPASVLLERIRQEKAKLVKAGKLKKKDLEEKPISEDEIPFEIPESWEWVRFGEISTYANTKKKINATKADSSIWGLDLEDIERGGKLLCIKSIGERKAIGDKTCFSEGDILYSKLRPYLLKILIAPKDGICTPEIIPFTCYGSICKDYVVSLLKSAYVDDYINSVTFGVKMPRVSTETMVSLIVPLPPLAEQRRIVAKIEELLPKVEEYGKAQEKLNKLNEELPERLKKSVLQEAIEGRLVPQDPNDEPASALLAKIREEKKQLVKEGKLKKKDLEENPISEDEIPFEIPDSWEWVRIKTIFDVCSARRVHEKDWRSSGIPFYRAREIGKLADNGFVDNDLFIDQELYDVFSKSGVPKEGDLMITAVGTLGKVYIVKKEEVFYYKDGSVLCMENKWKINPLYAKYVIESPVFINQYIGESQGTTVATLTMVRVNQYLFPLPPLAEQKRIVAKIEEVFKEIDKLKNNG